MDAEGFESVATAACCSVASRDQSEGVSISAARSAQLLPAMKGVNLWCEIRGGEYNHRPARLEPRCGGWNATEVMQGHGLLSTQP